MFNCKTGVDPGSVQSQSFCSNSGYRDRKTTPTKESSKKKASKPSISAVAKEIKALDSIYSERLSRLEAIFIARTMQPVTGQPANWYRQSVN